MQPSIGGAQGAIVNVSIYKDPKLPSTNNIVS
jgi:hypothetical protein